MRTYCTWHWLLHRKLQGYLAKTRQHSILNKTQPYYVRAECHTSDIKVRSGSQFEKLSIRYMVNIKLLFINALSWTQLWAVVFSQANLQTNMQSTYYSILIWGSKPSDYSCSYDTIMLINMSNVLQYPSFIVHQSCVCFNGVLMHNKWRILYTKQDCVAELLHQ